jgi:hypothetical protein
MQMLNPRSPNQAVAWASALITGKDTGLSGLCDHFVGLAYGWGHSGDAYALRTWFHAKTKYTDKTPPAGALVVWSYKGPHNLGHIALSAGGGNIISTDVPAHGQVGQVPLSWFAKHWPSFDYLGWIQPQFQAPAAPVWRPCYPAWVAPVPKAPKK